MDGLFFGSIGTIAETSDRQRLAFNSAFAEAGVPISWEPAAYAALLDRSGGANRIREQAAGAGLDLSDEQIAALHLRKTEIFDQGLIDQPVELRPGVARLIAEARDAGIKTAFVTTTSRQNVDALLASVAPHIAADAFDLVMTRDMVEAGKPAPEAYQLAMERLNLVAPVAIEDTAPSLRAALAADVPCIVTPGDYAGRQDFAGAAAVFPDLDTAQDTPEGRVTVSWLREIARVPA